MKTTCDANMPYVAEAFATLGEVCLCPGREISPQDVADSFMLITRSTTKINAKLLANSPVRFYGSAVIGTDHIDIPYLTAQGIEWCSAPGCNAESVANYFTASLLWLAGKHGFQLEGLTTGIIGAGNVGKRVARHAAALGMRVVINDPPRQRDPNDLDARNFVSLEQLLHEADIVTCHVPLNLSGVDATHHLLNAARLSMLKPGAIVINAARGSVVDTQALLTAKQQNVAHTIIDCWEGEPRYSTTLLQQSAITTPHIAGHSYEGKVNGTVMVYQGACAFLQQPATYEFKLPPPPISLWQADAAGRSEEDLLRSLVLKVYDIECDSQQMRSGISDNPLECAAHFDAQRSSYPMRREFAATKVELKNATPALVKKIRGLGFQI